MTCRHSSPEPREGKKPTAPRHGTKSIVNGTHHQDSGAIVYTVNTTIVDLSVLQLRAAVHTLGSLRWSKLVATLAWLSGGCLSPRLVAKEFLLGFLIKHHDTF